MPGPAEMRSWGVLRLTRPAPAVLAHILADQRSAAPAYPCIGGTVGGEAPPGFHHDHYEVELGRGAAVWQRAVEALKDWGPQRGSGLVVAADGPIAEGTTVALAAPLPVGCAVAVCRVVAVVDDPGRFGFAYGSLPVHPEEGEELFLLRHSDDVVRFEITSFSRPRHPLARLGAPVARRLQVRMTRHYLTAMAEAVDARPEWRTGPEMTDPR